MSLPWLARIFLPPALQRRYLRDQEQLRRYQNQTERRYHAADYRRQVEQYLRDYYCTQVPLIARTYSSRHFEHDLLQLLNGDGIAKHDVTAIADKIARRAEVASLEAFYDQHFPPGTAQYAKFDLVEEIDALDEQAPLTEYYDATRRLSARMERLIRELSVSGGSGVANSISNNLGDYRMQMRSAYEGIKQKVQKQAYPGASASVIADEIDNQWNAWQQQNGVFASITRSQLPSS